MAAVFIDFEREGKKGFLYVTLEPDARRRDGDVTLQWEAPTGFCFRIDIRAARKLVKRVSAVLSSHVGRSRGPALRIRRKA